MRLEWNAKVILCRLRNWTSTHGTCSQNKTTSTKNNHQHLHHNTLQTIRMKIERTWALAFLLLPNLVVSQGSSIAVVDTIECKQNFECGALEVCLEGNCVNSGDVDDNVAVSQVTVALGTACTEDDDCEGVAQICLADFCVDSGVADVPEDNVERISSPIPIIVGEDCTEDTDCDGVAKICLDGDCVDSGVAVTPVEVVEVGIADLCQGNPCPEGQICDRRTGGCLEVFVFEVALESDVCQGNPCGEGYFCISGDCIKKVVLPQCLVSCAGPKEICVDGECVEL